MFGGLSSSVFRTVSNTLVTDLTNNSQRTRVFSFLNLALNIGWGVGPLIGVYFHLASTNKPFILTGIVYLVYSVILIVLLHKYNVEKKLVSANTTITFSRSVKILLADKVLFWFVLGGMVLGIAWGQFPVLLSQFVVNEFADGIKIFGQLLTVNAITVVVVQLPVSKWIEKQEPKRIFNIGVLFVIGGLLCFSMATNILLLLTGIVLISVAETILMPLGNVLIEQIAPEGLKGIYFGASNFSVLGLFIGPVMGGFLMQSYGGRVMYLFLALVAGVGMFVYYFGFRQAKIQRTEGLDESIA